MISVTDDQHIPTEHGAAEHIGCAWRGCDATLPASNWCPILGPKVPGWCYAGNIPPDDIDGPLCPIHAEAFEQWAQLEIALPSMLVPGTMH